MIHLTKDEIDNHYGGYLQIGIKVEGDDNTSATDEWTAFDNFRLLYAGESPEAPDLVLDEDNPDLRYLTETIEEYNNCILHLKRSFELNNGIHSFCLLV